MLDWGFLRIFSLQHSFLFGKTIRRKGKSCMDKLELKNIMKNVKVHEVIELAFVGAKSSMNGKYRAISFSTRKGRGGVYEGNFKNIDTDEMLLVSSKDNEDILSLTRADGTFYGFKTEEEKILNLPTHIPQKENAKKLREQMLSLQNHIGKKVNLQSRDSSCNGEYTLEMLKKAKGKEPQLIACLKNEAGQPLEVWSYRHSGWLLSLVPA